MKITYVFLSFLLVFTACTTAVDLFTPGDPIPVVYCLLDPMDSVQYVRIGKTYAPEPGSENNQPTQDQILLKEDAIVYLSAEYSDRRQEIWYGQRIDTLPKNSGWFPSTINQIYAIPCVIQPNTHYSLYIRLLASNQIIHAETTSMGSLFTVIDPDIVPDREATLTSEIDYYVRFKPVKYGPIFQSTMTFRYADITGDIVTNRSLVFPQDFVFEDDTTVAYAEQRISGEQFLINVSRAIHAEASTKRIPLGLDFMVSCGGEDLALKIKAESDAQSFSILEVNSFNNAIGVFSCLSHHFVKDVPLSCFTIDTLALGSITGNLGFMTVEQIKNYNNGNH